jgi:hypothetical protein
LLDRTEYTGVDLSLPILKAARERWPKQSFDFRDIRDEPYGNGRFDFCIVCGVFTVKNEISYEETLALAHGVLKSAWSSVKSGMSFNCMSKHCDWRREDLFYWPLDDIMSFCKRELSPHVSFRLDYGRWDVATLVRKQPVPTWSNTSDRW